MSRWIRVAVILAAGGAAVLAATVGIAALLLPDPAPSGVSSDQPAGPATSPTPTTPNAPSQAGGSVEVTGEHTYAASLRSTDQLFPDTASFTLAGGNDFIRLTRGSDGLELPQAALDGLNFFLDTGDCALSEQQAFDMEGLVRLGVSCPDVGAAGGSPSVTIDGTLDLPIMIGVTDDRYAAGGVMSVGEVTELPVERSTWMVEFDERTHEQIGGDRFPVVSAATGGVSWTVWFNEEIAVTEVRRFTEEIGDEAVDLGDGCSAEEEILGKVAPNVDYLEVTFDCPDLTDSEGNPAALSGTIRIHRFEVFVPNFDF